MLYYSMEEVTPINIVEPVKEESPTYVKPDLVMEWQKFYLKDGHSIPSTRTYYSFIKKFVDYGIEINQKEVSNFRINNRQTGASGALKAFFRFLVYKKGFPESILNLRFDKSKQTKKFPESISPLEVSKLIDNMESVKDKLFTWTVYDLGLRLSEGIKLTWDNFNWLEWLQDRSKQGVVNIVYTKRGKFRALPVNPILMNALYDAHSKRTEAGVPIGNLVFDYGIMGYLNDKTKTPEQCKFDYIEYASKTYRNLIYRLSKNYLGKRINPHRLRHGKAQDLMDNGVPIETIKAFLGHEKISSTEIYAQASAEKIKQDLWRYYGKTASS